MRPLFNRIQSLKRRNSQIGRCVTAVFLTAAAGSIVFLCITASVCNSTPDPKVKQPDRQVRDFKFPDNKEPAGKPSLPRLAIIIDDIGYDKKIAEKFLSLNVPVTFSIFPHTPMPEDFIRRATSGGSEVMLHLPMEPAEYPDVNPGPGAIYSYMTEEELIRQLIKNLDAAPMITGVNNHMGSKISGMFPHMYRILSVIRQRNLFYVDSVTTDDSITQTAARLLGVPFAKRDVFLDHVQEYGFIRNQLLLLVQLSKKYGEAVGICHPHSVTYEVLKKELPKLKNQIHLVPASKIVHTIG